MSDDGATQYCTHTSNGTICDQCMGRPDHLVDANKKVPEPWVRCWVHRHHATDTRPSEHVLGNSRVYEVLLAAPVEAWAQEVKEWFKKFIERNSVREHADGTWRCCQCEQEAEPNGDFEHDSNCDILTAQRLLKNWPVKEVS